MDTVTGTTESDVLRPELGVSTLFLGLAGDDLLFAGRGMDTLDGGSGQDFVFYSHSIDGDGVDPVFPNGATINLSEGFATTTIDGQEIQHVLISIEEVGGTLSDDVIIGSSGSNVIFGWDGDDVIDGASGDDTLFAGTGNDEIFGGAGQDRISAGLGNDTLDGGSQSDLAMFGSSNGNREAIFPEGVVANLLEETGSATVNGVQYQFILRNFEDLTGSVGGDVLIGDNQSNLIEGLNGDDTLTGGEGDDQLLGGDGVDTAVFEGDQSNYTLSIFAFETTITDRRTDGQGEDTLHDIEFLDFGTESAPFGNGPMSLDSFNDATSLSSDVFGSIVELYIAYFNRAPDAIGLNFWASSFARGEVDLPGMAELFFDQSETRTAYASALSDDGSTITDVTAFVTAIYTNVLGRVPDERGRDFWVGVLERGEVTPGSAIGSIIEGAKVDGPSDATQAEIEARTLDQQYLSNATDIGVHFAVINGMSDTANADAVMGLLTRSSDSVTDAVALSNQFVADAQAAMGGEFLMPLVGVISDPFAV